MAASVMNEVVRTIGFPSVINNGGSGLYGLYKDETHF